jgi:lipopolysaccharide export system protein LptA
MTDREFSPDTLTDTPHGIEEYSPPCRALYFALFGLFCCVAFLLSAPVLAESLPITLSADRAEMDVSGNIGHYYGNVVLQRGEFTIRGAKMTIRSDSQHSVKQILIEGDPARLAGQASNRDAEHIEASANTIDYTLDPDETILLQGNAVLYRNRNQFSGETIQYFIAEQRVSAIGSTDSRQRVTITLFPDAPDTDSHSEATPDTDSRSEATPDTDSRSEAAP